jgi:hypothetical protein
MHTAATIIGSALLVIFAYNVVTSKNSGPIIDSLAKGSQINILALEGKGAA